MSGLMPTWDNNNHSGPWLTFHCLMSEMSPWCCSGYIVISCHSECLPWPRSPTQTHRGEQVTVFSAVRCWSVGHKKAYVRCCSLLWRLTSKSIGKCSFFIKKVEVLKNMSHKNKLRPQLSNTIRRVTLSYCAKYSKYISTFTLSHTCSSSAPHYWLGAASGAELSLQTCLRVQYYRAPRQQVIPSPAPCLNSQVHQVQTCDFALWPVSPALPLDTSAPTRGEREGKLMGMLILSWL